jgi:hypothetical protein
MVGIKSTGVLRNCVSFASSPSSRALIEPFSYSVHQNPKSHVVVEPAVPQLTDELQDFGERERGGVLDVIVFNFSVKRCTYDERDL